MTERLILHEYPLSGNCYKIRLTAAHVGAVLERRAYDTLRGETRTPEFLATVSANGRVPVLQIGERYLPESNAACFWLADGSPLIPADRFDRADMLRWMAWEQYNHEPNVATMRFLRAFVGEANWTPAQADGVAGRMSQGRAALALMDKHLRTHPFFVGATATLADLCLYAYTHVAEDGGFDLRETPAVVAWLARVAVLPGHVTILE